MCKKVRKDPGSRQKAVPLAGGQLSEGLQQMQRQKVKDKEPGGASKMAQRVNVTCSHA